MHNFPEVTKVFKRNAYVPIDGAQKHAGVAQSPLVEPESVYFNPNCVAAASHVDLSLINAASVSAHVPVKTLVYPNWPGSDFRHAPLPTSE